MTWLSRVFARGLVATLPVAVTIFVLAWLGRAFESVLGALVGRWLPEAWYVPGMGLAAGIVLVLLVGVLLEAWLARRVWRWLESLLDRVPIVRQLHRSVRELTTYLGGDATGQARTVVAVRVPGSPMRLVGFVTRDGVDEIGRDGGDLLAVYLPWSYQIGGFTVYLPRTEVEPLAMGVDEGMRFAFTAGVSRASGPAAGGEPASRTGGAAATDVELPAGRPGAPSRAVAQAAAGTRPDRTGSSPAHHDGMTIVTLTVNPALDASFEVDRIEPDRKLRSGTPRRDPGGGGVNVARAVHAFGGEAAAVVAVGGHTGAELVDRLAAEGPAVHRVDVAADTRENVTATERETGRQFRFTLPGATLTEAEQDRLVEAVRAVLGNAAILVISGSLPPDVPAELLSRVMAVAHDAAVPVVADTSGEALRAVASAHPHLIKPNLRELGELVDRSLDGPAEARQAAARLVENGAAEMVAVSLGDRGAWLVSREDELWADAPQVETESVIGAGDCMVAGLAMGLAEGRSPREILAGGVAAGAAAAMTPGTALARREDFERLRQRVRFDVPAAHA